MSSLDDLTSSLKKLGQKLTNEGRRTANVARLKIDLKGLDVQRREVLTRLGEKIFDLKKRKAIKDERLLETLVEQFDELEDLERKIEQILDEIQNTSLMQEMKVESEGVDVVDEPIENLTIEKGNPNIKISE